MKLDIHTIVQIPIPDSGLRIGICVNMWEQGRGGVLHKELIGKLRKNGKKLSFFHFFGQGKDDHQLVLLIITTPCSPLNK